MEERRGRGADQRAVDSVLRAVDFVEDRMGDDIGVEDMAKAACFSPFYFSRLFAQATGHAPYDYLMRRRVAAAAEQVIGSERSLTEIALDSGFAVPDGFGRAFRRCFGLLPSEARRTGSYPRSIARTRIRRDYVVEMLENPPPPPLAVGMVDTVLTGSRTADFRSEELRRGDFAVVERDAELRPLGAFIGTADGGAVPDYPRCATRLGPQPLAAFPIEGGLRLAFIVDYAYRVWLPASPFGRPPAYDLVLRTAEGNLVFQLPLAADS